MSRPIRVLVAKVGLDGHDRGAKVVASALRDAGMEVIYSGLHQTAEQVAATAVDEDVDVVGISTLSGAHMTLVPAVLTALAAAGRQDAVVVVGGIIPPADVTALMDLGVAQVFRPGTLTTEISTFLTTAVAAARGGG